MNGIVNRIVSSLLVLFALFSSGSVAGEGLRATTELTIDGVLVASPIVTFREGYPADMYLENEQTRLRVSLFSVPDGDKQHLRIQVFRSDDDGGLRLVGEPNITVALGDAFKVQVESQDGRGYSLEGVLERVTTKASAACPRVDDRFPHCGGENTVGLPSVLTNAEHSSAARACCSRRCRNGFILTCCGGCCSDSTNCAAGCCPQ